MTAIPLPFPESSFGRGMGENTENQEGEISERGETEQEPSCLFLSLLSLVLVLPESSICHLEWGEVSGQHRRSAQGCGHSCGSDTACPWTWAWAGSGLRRWPPEHAPALGSSGCLVRGKEVHRWLLAGCLNDCQFLSHPFAFSGSRWGGRKAMRWEARISGSSAHSAEGPWESGWLPWKCQFAPL